MLFFAYPVRGPSASEVTRFIACAQVFSFHCRTVVFHHLNVFCTSGRVLWPGVVVSPLSLPSYRELCVSSEEVVQVYGFCIRTLRLPVISVMIIGVMRLSYNERAVPDGRFRHHLFQAVFTRTTYPSRCVYFGWSRGYTAVESAVTAPVGM